MKQLLIILFSFLVIKTNSQTIFLTPSSKISNCFTDRIISKDTTLVDTVHCKFFITDTSKVLGDEASAIYFVNGYKVIIRKGELTKHWEQCECPEHLYTCLVYHQRQVTDYPPIISVKYLRKDKKPISQKKLEIIEIQKINTILEN